MSEIKPPIDPKKLFHFGDEFLEMLGKAVILWVRRDARNGIFQNGMSGLQYKSKEYMKYKANAMKRFTKSVIKKEGTTGIKYIGKKQGKQVASNIQLQSKITKGTKKVSGYANRSVNTDISKVNMILTGDLMKSMQIVNKRRDNSATVLTIGFVGTADNDVVGKITGNQVHNRELLGLREENLKKVDKMLGQQLAKNMIDNLPPSQTINL